MLAVLQQALTTSPDDTFRDFLDVAGIAIPLAVVVLVVALSWPTMKRWVRHRRHRRRHRRHRNVEMPAPLARSMELGVRAPLVSPMQPNASGGRPSRSEPTPNA